MESAPIDALFALCLVAMHCPDLSPAPPELIGLIRLREDLLAMEVTAGYFQRHPECAIRGDTASIRRICHEDMAHHVNQLVLALEIGDVGPFVGYIDWLRDVLEHRNLSIAHAAESLRLMRDWIEREIEHSNVGDATALLDYAVTLLEAPSSPNRSDAGLVPVRTSTALVKSRKVYTEALLTGRRETAVAQLLRAMAAGATLVDVSVDLVQPSMYQVGALWQQNRISVAQEHLASAITQGALAAGFGKAEFAPPNGRSAAFACVQDNHHAIGLRMVSDAFEVAALGRQFPWQQYPDGVDCFFRCREQARGARPVGWACPSSDHAVRRHRTRACRTRQSGTADRYRRVAAERAVWLGVATRGR